MRTYNTGNSQVVIDLSTNPAKSDLPVLFAPGAAHGERQSQRPRFADVGAGVFGRGLTHDSRRVYDGDTKEKKGNQKSSNDTIMSVRILIFDTLSRGHCPALLFHGVSAQLFVYLSAIRIGTSEAQTRGRFAALL